MILLISWPFNKQAYTRLGIDTLEERDIDFKILNLFDLLYPENKKLSFNRKKYRTEITIKSFDELEQYLKEKKIILNFLNIKRKTLKVYLLLTKLKLDYISFSNMPLPVKRNNILRILNLFLKPAKYAAVVNKKREFPVSKRSEIIKINSIDYDTMIRFEREKNERIIKYNYIVFLDQNLPFHLDFVRNNEKSYVTANVYYESLNNYFDYIEKKMQKKVIIAQHPNSNDANYFGRTMIKNNTINLIKYADSILTHSSTAISFAIMYDKPISMIITNEIQSSKMQLFNNCLSKKLAIPLVNIDQDKKISFVRNKKEFCLYKKNYITPYQDINLLSMEIILNNLKVNENE